MIEVDHLTKRYGSVKAIENISFEVEKGEILGFLGPNGAGKTTTMRILTCFLPATEGTARVAGFDVFDNPMAVKKHLGYLPENPPLYQELTVDGFLDFVAKIKGVDSRERKKRIEEVKDRVSIKEYSKTIIKNLSKGYKQRVGLAQALIHDPQVLILDEPTVGLDPNQIIEVRQLIKSLSGNHTIILSTHILPEVSMTCQRVVIISKGRIAAMDTPENLIRQLQGAERLYLEVKGPENTVKTRLKEIEGVLRVDSNKLDGDEAYSFSVETELKTDVRSKVARKVVESGYDLLELRAMSMSLEEVFLQLTTKEEGVRGSMKNVLAIFEKEMKSYFVSPIAYVVLTVFLVISGYFFYNILTIFMERSMFAAMQSQQFGGPPPSIDVPALVSRNFFGILSTVILFMLPMITMATFADEKRRGTMELLMTSPITNLQVILGKFLGALAFFFVMLLPTLFYQIFILVYSSPRMAFGPIFSGYLGLLLLGGSLIALGIFISTLTENQIVAASVTFGAFLILWVIDLSGRTGGTTLQEILSYLSILNHFEDFSKGVIDTSSVVIYSSFIFLGLFLTFRSIESLRWRQ